MVCDLGGVVLGRLAVNALEGVGDCEVVGLQPRQRHCRQHALADEVVREAIALGAGPGQQPGLGRLFKRLTHLAARQLAEGLEQRDVEVAPDHRGSGEHAVRRLAEPLEAAADEAAHALRELEIFLRVARVRSRAHATEEALGLGHVEV